MSLLKREFVGAEVHKYKAYIRTLKFIRTLCVVHNHIFNLQPKIPAYWLNLTLFTACIAR